LGAQIAVENRIAAGDGAVAAFEANKYLTEHNI